MPEDAFDPGQGYHKYDNGNIGRKGEADERPPLWWDDASYIRYQSDDPMADAEERYRATLHLLTVYTSDYCAALPGGMHRIGCPKQPLDDDCPF